MADLQKTIEIIFEGKSELGKLTGSFNRDFDQLNKSVTDIAAPLAKAADMTLMLEAALAALAVGGMALAIKTAGDFSGQFAEITTLIDDTGAPIEAFEADVKSYASTSVKSISEINGAVYSAISAGVDYKNSVDFVAQSEKLAVAAKGDLDTTTKVLISTLNAYGESTDQAGKYSDILFATVKAGQTTLPELSGALSRVTASAAALGIPFETVGAALATLTAKGMPTSQAITALQGAMTGLIKPTGQASAQAKLLEIDFSAAAVKSKGFEVVLKEVMEATGGNIAKMSQLFGSVEGLNGVLSLGENGLSMFTEKLDVTRNSAGMTQTAYDKMALEMEKINQRLVTNFELTLGEIGEKLLPQYTDIVTNSTGILAGIGEATRTGAFDPIFDLIEEFGTNTADLLGNIAENLPAALEGIDYSKLIASLRELGSSVQGAFEAVFGDVDLSTAEGLHDAIQKGVDGLTTLQNVVSGIIEGMKPLFETLGFAIENFDEMGAEAEKATGKVLGWGKTATVFLEYSGIVKVFIGLLSGSLMISAVGNIVSMGKALGGMSVILKGMVGASGPLIVAAAAILAITQAWQYSTTAAQDEDHWLTKVSTSVLELVDHWGLLTGVTQEERDAQIEANKAFEAARIKVKALGEEQEQTGEGVEIFRKKLGAIPDDMDKIIDSIDRVPDLEIAVNAEGTKSGLSDVFIWVEGETDEFNLALNATGGVKVPTKVDQESLDAAKKKLDDDIPKVRDLQVKIATEMIKAQAQVATATIEAEAKKMESAFDSLNVGIASTGDTLTDLWGTLGDSNLWTGDKWSLMQTIDREEERRQSEFDLQQDLIGEQIRLTSAKATAIESGGAMINIDGAGLQPHLEAFMWEVLEAIQVRANAEGAEFLLGL